MVDILRDVKGTSTELRPDARAIWTSKIIYWWVWASSGSTVLNLIPHRDERWGEWAKRLPSYSCCGGLIDPISWVINERAIGCTQKTASLLQRQAQNAYRQSVSPSSLLQRAGWVHLMLWSTTWLQSVYTNLWYCLACLYYIRMIKTYNRWGSLCAP